MSDKNKMLDSLSKNLPERAQKQEVAQVKPNKDITDDYEKSRATYYNLIDRGEQALEGMMDLAAESEHPRAYEVLSGMMKNMADITDKLMELQKRKDDLIEREKKNQPPAGGMTQNNVFVGSTTDLQRMLLKNNADVIDVDSDE